MINLSLETAGETYTSKGKTMLEALEGLPLDWEHIKAKGVFTFTDGKNKGQKLLYLKQLRMIFANKLRRYGWVRQFEALLEANAQLNATL